MNKNKEIIVLYKDGSIDVLTNIDQIHLSPAKWVLEKLNMQAKGSTLVSVVADNEKLFGILYILSKDESNVYHLEAFF